MSIPVSCPHCTATFKIKSKSAIGKKVKCPKCDVPFVIENPDTAKPVARRKKPSQSKPVDDFFDEDFEDEVDSFADEDDEWDAGFYNRPASKSKTTRKSKPTAKSKRTAKSKPSKRFSPSDYGFTPFTLIVMIGLFLVNLILYYLGNPLMPLIGGISILFAIGFLLAGGLGLLIEAARESGTELILCLIVPLYKIYFAISRFESTKNAVAAYITGAFLLSTTLLFFFSFSPGSRNRGFSKPPSTASVDSQDTQVPSDDWPQSESQKRLLKTPSIRKPDFQSLSSASRPGAFKDRTPQNNDSNSFDFSTVTPFLVSWNNGGQSSINTLKERKTKSIATVFEGSNTKPVHRNAPGGNMKFRVYLPPGSGPDSLVPCVLVPPAGSNLLSGLDIDSNDLIPNPEHESYIKAGFAVVTFSLDGSLRNPDNLAIPDLQQAYTAFKASQAGLLNCLQAFFQTQMVIPGIDKNRVYIAGHSSAGTLALLFAEHQPKIKGCLAYAPSVDLEKNFAPGLADIKKILPDIEDFIKRSSPKTHLKNLKCPVFLYHAKDDPVTSYSETQRFAEQLKAQGTEVEFVSGQGSDHYQTMVDEGLPRGVAWLKNIAASSSSISNEPSMAAADSMKPEDTTMSQPAPTQSLLTRQRATFKITGFNDFYNKTLNSTNQDSRDFWTKSLKNDVQSAINKFLPGYVPDSVNFVFDEMTVSFDFHGKLPDDFASQFADALLGDSIKIEAAPLLITEVKLAPNAAVMNSNVMTFGIITLSRLRYPGNEAAATIVDANMKQIPRYIPGSVRINPAEKWVYLRLKGLGEINSLYLKLKQALFQAGIVATQENYDLTPEDLAKSTVLIPNSVGPEGRKQSATPAAETPPADAKLKYIIKYGIYGGDAIKESVLRSLQGFAWVNQKSIHFNPDKKEITFENRSPVDQGALGRALTRNKFYQLNITQEVLPETEKAASKDDSETK